MLLHLVLAAFALAPHYVTSWLYWPLFCCLLAYPQGQLMPAIRRTPPGPEATRQSHALHGWLGLAYFAPLAFSPTWQDALWGFAAALLARIALFDPVLNTGAGSPLFYVGETAGSDRLLRKLSPAHPERLAGILHAAALAAYVALAAGRLQI